MTTRIEVLIAAVKRHADATVSGDAAMLILRDLDRHARALRMPGKSIACKDDLTVMFAVPKDDPLAQELMNPQQTCSIGGVVITENPAVPADEVWVQQFGRVKQVVRTQLCPFHGDAYRPDHCVVCESIATTHAGVEFDRANDERVALSGICNRCGNHIGVGAVHAAWCKG